MTVMNRGWGPVHVLAGSVVGILLWITTFSVAIPLLTVAAYWICVGWPRRDSESDSIRPTPSFLFMPLYVYGVILLLPAAPQSALEVTHGRFAKWSVVFNEFRKKPLVPIESPFPKNSPVPRHEAGLAWKLAPGTQLYYRVTQNRKFQGPVPKFRGATELNILFEMTFHRAQADQLEGQLFVREYTESSWRDNGDIIVIDSTKKLFQVSGSTEPDFAKQLDRLCADAISFQVSANGANVRLADKSASISYGVSGILDEITDAFPLVFTVLDQDKMSSGRIWTVQDHVDDLDDLPVQLMNTISNVSQGDDTQVDVDFAGTGDRKHVPGERDMAAKCDLKGRFRFNASRGCIETVTRHESTAWALARDSDELSMKAENEIQVQLIKATQVALKPGTKADGELALPLRTKRSVISPAE